MRLKVLYFYFLSFFCVGFSVSSQSFDDGIEPPLTPIDDSIIVSMVVAILLSVYVVYFKKRKLSNRILLIPFFTSMLFLSYNSVFSQVHNNGVFHVGSNATFYVKSGDISFGASSSTSTSKSSPYVSSDGKIILGSSANFAVVQNATKYVNGFAGTFNTNETILAIGAGFNYAPIKVAANSNGQGVHAAYFNSAPLATFVGLDASVSQVANSEYWIVKGDNTILSLSWRSNSNLSSFSYPDLTIVGYKNGKWEAIASSIDVNSVFGGSSSLSGSGSISTLNAVVLADYDAFAIGEKSTLSAGEFTVDNAMVVFINNDYLHIESKVNIEDVSVFDVSGRLIISYKNNTSSASIAIPFNYASAMYILKAKLNNGQLFTKKLLKN